MAIQDGTQLQNIGNALSGFSAGLQGQLPQFQQGLQQQQLINQQQQERQQQMAIERQKTMFTDAQAALNLLDSDNVDGVIQLGLNRLELLQNFPDANPEDTQRLTQLAIAAKNGSEEAKELLRAELENTVEIGKATGVLGAPERGTKVVGDYLVDDQTGEVVFSANESPGPKTDLGEIEFDRQQGWITDDQYSLLKEQIENPAPELKSDRDRRKADYARLFPEWTEEQVVAAVDSEVITDPTSDVKSLYNPLTGDLTALPLNYPEPDGSRPEISYEDGIYALAPQAAGLVPAAGELYGRIAGQFGAGTPEALEEARQYVKNTGLELINSLRQGNRYIQGETDFLSEQINMLPQVIDSPPSFQARARALDEFLRRRRQTEAIVGENLSLPKERRDAARITVEAIDTYLNQLQVPPKISVEQLVDGESVAAMPIPVLQRFVEDNRQTPEVIDALPEDVRDALLEALRGNR